MKLNKKEIKAKSVYHEKRKKYYDKKLADLEKEEKRIGFKY
jgi:cytochrome c-type biogenesis protein CcmH/NrfG